MSQRGQSSSKVKLRYGPTIPEEKRVDKYVGQVNTQNKQYIQNPEIKNNTNNQQIPSKKPASDEEKQGNVQTGDTSSNPTNNGYVSKSQSKIIENKQKEKEKDNMNNKPDLGQEGKKNQQKELNANSQVGQKVQDSKKLREIKQKIWKEKAQVEEKAEFQQGLLKENTRLYQALQNSERQRKKLEDNLSKLELEKITNTKNWYRQKKIYDEKLKKLTSQNNVKQSNQKDQQKQAQKKQQHFQKTIKEFRSKYQKLENDKNSIKSQLQYQISSLRQEIKLNEDKIHSLQEIIKSLFTILKGHFNEINTIGTNSFEPQKAKIIMLLLKNFKTIMTRNGDIKNLVQDKMPIIESYITQYFDLVKKDFTPLDQSYHNLFDQQIGFRMKSILQKFNFFSQTLENNKILVKYQESLSLIVNSFLDNIVMRTILKCKESNDYPKMIEQMDEYIKLMTNFGDDFRLIRAKCIQTIKKIDKEILEHIKIIDDMSAVCTKGFDSSKKLYEHSQAIKSLISFTHTVKIMLNYRYFCSNYQKHMRKDIYGLKDLINNQLRSIKVSIQSEINSYQASTNYYQNNKYLNVLSIIKNFDWLCGKQYNYYHNFKFYDLYKIVKKKNQILIQQKICQINLIVNEKKINYQQLRQELSNKNFQSSFEVQNALTYRLKKIIAAKFVKIEAISQITLLTIRHLEKIRQIFEEITELKAIIQKNKLPKDPLDIDKYFQIINSKLPIIDVFFEFRYNYLHQNIYTSQLEQVKKEITFLIDFEYFFKDKFPQSHSIFKDKMKNKNQLPDSQVVFSHLADLLEKRKIFLEAILSKGNMLDEKDYKQILLYRSSLTLQQQNIIDQKVALDIQTKIKDLQTKQWEKGQFNSENQMKLRNDIHTLAYHTERQKIEQLQILKNQSIDLLAQKINSIKQLVSKNNKQAIDKYLLPAIRKQQARKPQNATKLLQIFSEHYKSLLSTQFKEIKQKIQFIKQHIYSFRPQNEPCLRIKSFFAQVQFNIYKNAFEQSNNLVEIEAGFKQERQISQKTWHHMDQLEYIFDLYAFLIAEQKSSIISQQKLAEIHKIFVLDKLNKSKTILSQMMKKIDIKLQMNASTNKKILITKIVKINYFRSLLIKCPNIKQVNQAEFIINEFLSIFRQLLGKVQNFSFEYIINAENKKESLIIKELQQMNEAIKILQSIQQCGSLLAKKLALDIEQINLTKKIKNIEMNWRSLFDKNIKANMPIIFTLNQEVDPKFDLVINLRKYVYDYNICSFIYISNEEFDITKIIFAESKRLYQQTKSKAQQLYHKAKQYLASNELRTKQIEKNINNELEKIRNHYDLMGKKIEQRFEHEDPTDLAKIQLKQAELIQKNQLQQDQIDKVKAYYQTTLNKVKDNWQQIKTNLIHKIIDNMAIMVKVSLTFNQQEIKRQIQKNKEALTSYYQKLPIKDEFIEKFTNSSNVYIGKLIKENSLFQQLRNQAFNKSVEGTNDIHYVINNCKQIKNKDSAQIKELIDNYKIYKEQLQRIQKIYKQQRTESCFNNIIEETRQIAKNIKYPLLIAKIFAIQSIIRIKHKEVLKFVRNPHPAQIVAIFLLISPKKSRSSGDFDNGMVEVKTGEGKSVVLAGLCAFMALKGYQAYCACYSSYLSERDQKQFHVLFEKLGVLNRVKYGTFADHCKEILNEVGHTFKQVVKQYLLNNNQIIDTKQKQYLQRLKKKFEKRDITKRILIIDEVDVFFQERYFGQFYRPAISVEHKTIRMLIKFIWDNRDQGKTNKNLLITRIKEADFYKQLLSSWKHLENFFNNQIQGLIGAAVDHNHTYEILDREIVYRYNEVVEKQLNSGYKTVFTACSEMQSGNISPQFFQTSQRMSFIISEFSYAELPKYYSNIMGVSGTLETLSRSKKQVMIQRYQIKNFYILPSIFGQSRRNILNPTIIKNNYQQNLIQRISQYNKTNRPIIVYFKTKSDMMSFYRSYQSHKKCSLPFLNEDHNQTVRDQLIVKAGQKRKITLMTSYFSRGTDFMLQDKEITQGYHVIQTYISKDESDYVQVYGRTARQGKKGSFEMYIKAQLLNQYNITKHDSNKLLDQIKLAWNRKDQEYGVLLNEKISAAEVVHNNSKKVIQSLMNGPQAMIKELQRLNYVKPTYKKNVKSIIAIDGTGSMGHVIGKVKDVIQIVVVRSEQIIHDKNLHASFQQQIIIYRNYSSPPSLILQCSGFSSDPKMLSEWIGNVRASGGFGEREAVELVYNKVASMNDVNQLIIIGDAGANTPDEIIYKRNYGNPSLSYWRDNGISIVKSDKQQLQQLIKRQIPVHSFYILTGNSGVKEYFTLVSDKTNGVCEEFQIHDMNAGQKLAKFIAQKLLNQIGGQVLVQQYRMRYG